MFSQEPPRMYAALRCIEVELEKEKPSISRIRAIMLEAGRELRPTKYALDGGLRPCQPACFANKIPQGEGSARIPPPQVIQPLGR